MDRKQIIKKSCNYCNECGYNYPLDIQFCPKCKSKLFPVPYTPLDIDKEKIV